MELINNTLNSLTKKKMEITKENFNSIGNFEKKILGIFGQMLGYVKDGNIDDYEEFLKLFNNLTHLKQDSEKEYLMGIFFPKKIDVTTFISPFPTPVFTYKQTFTFNITPNESGSFLVEVVSPFLNDLTSSTSDVKTCTDVTLDGGTQLTNTALWNPVAAARVKDGVFNAYVLMAASIEAKYVGRYDIKSGYLGGSYFLSAVNSDLPDVTLSNFDNIDRSATAVQAGVDEGIEIIYFPPDNSFMEFRKPNVDNYASGTMSMTHRMVIYGRSLPKGSLSQSSILINITRVFATIPTSSFLDITPTQFPTNTFTSSASYTNVVNSVMNSGFVTRTTGESEHLENALELPSPKLTELVKDYSSDDLSRNKDKKERFIRKLKRMEDTKINLDLKNFITP
jgi:hypothetical protein